MSEESVRCGHFGLGGQVWEIEGNYLLMIPITEAIEYRIEEKMIGGFRPEMNVRFNIALTKLP